jgi:hypothetical protein
MYSKITRPQSPCFVNALIYPDYSITLQKKLEIISRHPHIGSPRSKKDHKIRFTILNKRVMLIYKIKSRKNQIELLLFWNTWQHPKK